MLLKLKYTFSKLYYLFYYHLFYLYYLLFITSKKGPKSPLPQKIHSRSKIRLGIQETLKGTIKLSQDWIFLVVLTEFSYQIEEEDVY